MLEALEPTSEAALVARQIPISQGEQVIGFVDLALDRAFQYQAGKPSEQVPLPEELREVEGAARFHMLEQLADHDDELLEQLLTDQVPDLATVFGDIKRETAEGLVVPVMFGSAVNGFGVRRLLKALRHDTPAPAATAARLGIDGAASEVFRISNDSSVGRLALARVFGGALPEGAELQSSSGQTQRAGALFALQGGGTIRLKQAEPGDVVGIAKADAIRAGDRLGQGRAPGARAERPSRTANAALSIAVKDHKDEVRLSTALNRLIEEDLGLSWETSGEMHETPAARAQRRAPRARARAAQAALRARGQRARAGGGDPRDRAQGRLAARPAQEAVGRPRPVRRRGHRAAPAGARRGLRVRGQDHRRRDPAAMDPRGRAGHPRRDAEGPARLPGGRRRGDAWSTARTTASTARSWRSAPPGASR